MGHVTASPAVEVVERLLDRAHRLGASDLHLDPGVDGVCVMLRRDGVLQPCETLPAALGPHVVGRLKALAGLLAYRTDLPQEGRIPAERSGIGAEVRVATYPALGGERVALRFDAPGAAPSSLDALGLPAGVAGKLRAALDEPEGVLLLTGPSGSGKTTTLHACLRHLAGQSPRRGIVTVEDPVERRIEGVVQTEVNPAAGLDFARALRSLLRQDPDVLLLGEIRDRETAAIALEAGLTGHLVMATLHAGTAAQVFARLLELDVEPFVLTTAVRGVLAQRLVRRRCCASGCARCRGTGYSGRLPVAEWAALDGALRKAVLRRADGAELESLCPGPRLDDEARALVARGLTTQEEVDRVLGRARGG